jgi:hypothetical protein
MNRLTSRGAKATLQAMGRLEREIKNHPVGVAKSAFGPYVGWFVIVLVYGWPFAVFHGTARLAVVIPWLVVTILITMAVIGGREESTCCTRTAETRSTA